HGMDRSGGTDEGRAAPRQDHRRPSRTRPRAAVIPARAAPHLRVPARRRAVPGVRDNDPNGSAGGPKRVLVPELSDVTGCQWQVTYKKRLRLQVWTGVNRVCLVFVKTIPRFAATIFAGAAALGLMGVGVATEAQAHPGPPVPQWCPGEWWDPGWGDN